MTVSKKELNTAVSRHVAVKARTKRLAMGVADRAAARHAQHHDTGDSFIGLEHGDVNWYISLNDERGLQRAWNMEFGWHDKNGEFHDGVHSLAAEVGDPYS